VAHSESRISKDEGGNYFHLRNSKNDVPLTTQLRGTNTRALALLDVMFVLVRVVKGHFAVNQKIDPEDVGEQRYGSTHMQ